MKKFKRVITAVILLSLILSSLQLSVGASEEKNFDKEVEFLRRLNVIDEDFEPYFSVRRQDFAKIIVNIIFHKSGFEASVRENEYVFNDVSSDNEFYPYIKACKDLGIVNGSSSYFYPDDVITFDEAVAMLVNALGYSVYTESLGGYPTGYYAVANQCGMLKGLSLKESVTGYAICKLVYNSLFSDVVTMDSVSDKGPTYIKDNERNILSEKMGIEELDCRIIDNGLVSLDGESICDKNKLVVENMKNGYRTSLFAGDTDISLHLGCNVLLYYYENEDNGRNEILFYYLKKEGQETIINAEDVTYMDSDKVEYEDNNEKIKKINNEIGGPVVIFNGIKVTDNIPSYLPEDGIIRLVDYDKDNKTDLIEIFSFNIKVSADTTKKDENAYNIIVNKTEDDSYIGCSFNPALSVDMEDNDNYLFVVKPGYKKLEDLKSGVTVSVAISPKKVDGGRIYQLIVSDKKVSGKVSSLDKADNRIEVDGADYYVSSSLYSVKTGIYSSLSNDIEYTFCLNIENKIVYVENYISGMKNYAYLMGAYETKDKESLKGKFMLKDGKIKEYSFADKVNVDGVVIKEHNEVLRAIKKRGAYSDPTAIGAPSDIFDTEYQRPVVLTVNKQEEVTKVDTDVPNYPEKNELTSYSSETIIPYSKEETEDNDAFKAGFRSPRIEEISRYTTSLSGRFYITGETLVMFVPTIDVWGLDRNNEIASNKKDASYNQNFRYDFIKLYELDKDDSNYRVSSGSAIENYIAYDIQGYDIDKDTGVARLVVIRGSDKPYIYGRVPYDKTYPMSVFLKSSKVYDEQLEKTVTKIYYTSDGKTENYATIDQDDALWTHKMLINGLNSASSPYNKEVTPLKKGDIIRVIKDGAKVDHIERVFHIDTIKNAYSMALFPSYPRIMYSNALTGISTMPCDERGYYAGVASGYYLAVSRPYKYNQSSLTSLLGASNLSDINTADRTSYLMQTVDCSTVESYTKIFVKKNNEVVVSEGKLSDIKTVEETGVEDSSILIYHDYYHQIGNIIIVNFEK